MERKKSTEDSDAIPEDNSDKDNLLKKDDSILPSSVHLVANIFRDALS